MAKSLEQFYLKILNVKCVLRKPRERNCCAQLMDEWMHRNRVRGDKRAK